MSDNSPTDNGGQDTGDLQGKSLPENNQNESAEEQQDAVSGGNTQDADQESKDEPQNRSTQSKETDSSDADDDGLAKFAKSQGFDFESLSDNELKALKLAHENQKAFRSERQEKKQTNDLQKNLKEATQPNEEELESESPAVAEMRRTQAMVAQLESKQRVTDFYLDNPEARDYDKEMGEIVKEEAAKFTNPEEGKAAARYLASDLERLLLLAKARRGTDSSEAIEAARREERESLRREQEGAGESPAAQTRSQGTPKVTREWVTNEYDPSNPEHQKMVDEAMSRGDLY
jgi:hypothetical protein